MIRFLLIWLSPTPPKKEERKKDKICWQVNQFNFELTIYLNVLEGSSQNPWSNTSKSKRFIDNLYVPIHWIVRIVANSLKFFVKN